MVAAAVLAVAVGAIWSQVVENRSERTLPWQDVTAQLGPVLWPKSVTRSFWKRRQVTRFLARTFPRGAPKAPAVDFTRHRLILVAAGPRSSTGYGVRIVRVRERRADILVVAREVTPALGDSVTPQLASPYRLITIPATSKRVYFTWQGRP